VPHYRVPSRFPSTYRDVALVVRDDVSAREVERAVAAAAGPMCAGVHAFDEYRGPQVADGHKSLAVRVTLQRSDATITDEEADAAIAAVLAALGERLGATIRT
jgi:phenylalanyl-tRNA synthetase beta chain